MAVTKSKSGGTRQPISDVAVDVAMGGMANLKDDPVYGRIARQAQRARTMTPAQRRKEKRDAARTKVTYDLPKEIIDEINRLAGEGYFPQAHLVGLLLHYGLKLLHEGKIDLDDHRVIANVPRYEYFLRIDPEAENGLYGKF